MEKNKLLIMALLVFGLSCQGRPPKWDGKFWAGSSGVSGIERKQTQELIKCQDPAFDDYLCLKYDDFLEYRLSCERPGTSHGQ